MRKKCLRHALNHNGRKLFAILFAIISATASVFAQASTEADALRARLARARALAAAHNLAAAANELDEIRKTTTDDSVRDIARLMLMGVCLEEGNYMRAQTLLDELYTARSAQRAGTTEAYFALAGQALNGAREHLERYRAFGISLTDKDLPSDAVSDLDRLRALLEKIADHARQMTVEDAKATDAAALLEDVSSLRASLARSTQDRQQWQREMASARQKLSAEDARLTHVSQTSNSPRTIPVSSENSKAPRNETANNAPKIETKQQNTAASNSTMTTQVAAVERTDAPPPALPVKAASEDSSKPLTNKALNVGSLIEKATQKISPSYPQAAKGARITGMVTVYVEVDQAGAVSTAQSTSGPILLRQAAVEAARRWKFRPTVVDGQPVRVAGYINFNFTL